MQKNIWILAGLLLILQACYKDKGNYDLVDYNKTSITSASGRAVILGDTLHLTTNITWKYPDRDTTAFSYEWRVEDSLISTDRNLTYVPTKAGLIMYHFYIIEKATQIASRFSWQISVNSPYKAGWLLLTEKDGQSGLTYVRRDQWKDEDNKTHYNYVLYPDFYQHNFPNNPLGSNPRKLVTKVFPDYSADQVLILQDQESVFLDGADMSKLVYMVEDFQGGVYPIDAKPIGYFDGGPTNFVLFSNGDVYWKRNAKTMGGVHEEQFMNVPMYFEGGGAKISKFIDNQIFNSSFLYMYDTDKNRFISSYTTTGSNDYIGSKMYIVNATPPPPEFVDLNDMTGYRMLYSADYANSAYYMNIIKEESTGDYYYQTYRAAQKLTALEISEHHQELFAADDIISDNTVFYRIYTSSYLYFGEGSKLYFYDVNTKRIKLYTDFGSGNIVKMTADANEGELGVVLDNGSFYICSLNNALLGEDNPGATGILYEAKNVGNVIDLKWKWGSYYDYIFRRYPN